MPNGMSDSDSQETPSSNASTPKSGTSIRIKAQAAENVCSLMSVFRGHRGHDRIEILDLQLPMHSEPITTNVVSSNPAQVRCT
jgi:hypothetical protein